MLPTCTSLTWLADLSVTIPIYTLAYHGLILNGYYRLLTWNPDQAWDSKIGKPSRLIQGQNDTG
jgi:hypothetical protein